MNELQFNPTTPIWFYALTSTYVSGTGQTDTWSLIIASPLYCEWIGSFGDVLSDAQAMGVQDSATVRTFYHPDILAKLQSAKVAIVKNSLTDALSGGVPNANNPNVYQLWGAANNLGCRKMQFRVKRWESI